MTTTIIWFMGSLAIAVAAMMRGRNWLGWFLVAMILSPVAAALFVLALPRRGAFGISVRPHPDLTPIFETSGVHAGATIEVVSM